jgi:hypothetical protein
VSGGVGDVVAAATHRKPSLEPPVEREAYHCANASPIEVPLIVVWFQS